jgi:hypothetical protein
MLGCQSCHFLPFRNITQCGIFCFSLLLYNHAHYQLMFVLLSFFFCVFWSSLIYGFWLPIWHLQTLLVLNSKMTSFIGHINNIMIQFTTCITLHMRIVGPIIWTSFLNDCIIYTETLLTKISNQVSIAWSAFLVNYVNGR